MLAIAPSPAALCRCEPSAVGISLSKMAFFGTTCHGDYQSLLKTQTACCTNSFAGIEQAVFEEAFDKLVLRDSTQFVLASVSISANGKDVILRESLIELLKHILGRRATKQEFDTFFKHFDFESDCVMSRQEFRRSYSSLLQFASRDEEQREWHSYSLKHADWLRHKRLRCSPQEIWVSDLTESQRVGCVSTVIARNTITHQEMAGMI